MIEERRQAVSPSLATVHSLADRHPSVAHQDRRRGPGSARSLRPLERACTPEGEPDSPRFARLAKLALEKTEVTVTPVPQGIVLSASTEEDMDAALDLLESTSRFTFQAGPPTVRNHRGAVVEQPWAGIRIHTSAPHAAAVRRELRTRAARTMGPATFGSAVTFQATLPLLRALGLRERLRHLTEGDYELESWLSHYEPLVPPPSGGDAA